MIGHLLTDNSYRSLANSFFDVLMPIGAGSSHSYKQTSCFDAARVERYRIYAEVGAADGLADFNAGDELLQGFHISRFR